MASLTDCMKGGKFEWTKGAETTFQKIKERLTTIPILVLPDFQQPFELHSDALKVGIGAVLSQNSKPIAFFSGKLTGAKVRYNTYDVEFYAVVQAHKSGVTNRVADALSRRRSILSRITVELHDEDHVGRDRTLQLVQSSYLWPTIRKEVEKYVQRCKKTTDAMRVAQLYFRKVYRLHGLPVSIVSNRDTRFLSHFWRSLWKMVNTQLNFSTAYHPQTDGQIKVVNRSLGNLLRGLVGEHMKSWDQKLSPAEFTHNHAVNRSTGFSPFQVVYSVTPWGNLLRGLVGEHMKSWDQKLSPAEFMHNHAVNRSTGFSPFQVVYSVTPGVPLICYPCRIRPGFMGRFSAGDYHKLAARKIGHVEIVEKINSNAYWLKLPSHIRTVEVFNVKHLIPYIGDSSDDDDSRANSLHPCENDVAEDLTSRYLEKIRF
ncbi:hypothetical protein CRG98_002552 [Punica granatum]|uniref:Integrase catalytic domain-containing protein n=1 Tax=Punica granatum TaxID=22663 RepID=A0A2I0L8L9_PUNGR|nr:hypothetical protein CRG98_002552 [Punica granatum]